MLQKWAIEVARDVFVEEDIDADETCDINMCRHDRFPKFGRWGVSFETAVRFFVMILVLE